MTNNLARRVYNYLEEVPIFLEGPKEMLDLCQRNIEEAPTTGECQGEIKLIRGSPVTIIKDKEFPYASIKQSQSHINSQWDYFRYGTLTRSYWSEGSNQYVVRYHIKDDCDGPLRCFWKIYFDSPASADKSLVHGTLVAIGARGILISGPCRSGKTTLGLSMISSLDAQLISEGLTLISRNMEHQLRGYYLPRPIYSRFSTISKLPGLSELIENSDLWDVGQHFDIDALKRIIRAKRFDIDAGIQISRKKFGEIMGTPTKRTSNIDLLILTRYIDGKLPKIEKLSSGELIGYLRKNEFKKLINLGEVENQRSETPPEKSQIDETWFEQTKGILFSFSGINDLNQGVLEELVK